MTLILAILGRESLEDGSPAIFTLDRRDAVIGRSDEADWCLPDGKNHLSSQHCNITYRDGDYLLVDRSTNGTFVNDMPIGAGEAYPIMPGDRIGIGSYQLVATIAREPGDPGDPGDPRSGLDGAEPLTTALDGRKNGHAYQADATTLLRHMVKGVIGMIDARSRAKADLGLQHTTIELEGNNLLKFIRAPDRALEALLMPPLPGFMPAARAIDDAFLDLQAHEVAMMAATHAALERSITLFSPAAIRARRRRDGRLAFLFPALREAALWRSYEREFEGVVHTADAAFMEVFAKEFRQEYERHVAEAKDRRRRERVPHVLAQSPD